MTLEFTPEKTRIGWIGTGVMGSSMCGHLVAAGYKASVYNRSAEKAKALLEKGAKLLDSPRAVAQASDVVFTIVGYPKDVREVTLGENGALAGASRRGAGRYDNERAGAGGRDRSGRQGKERAFGRCTGLGWRRRRERGEALDHGRRREARL